MDTPEAAMDKMYDINFKSAFYLAQEAIPYLKKRPNSNIIVMSSYAGKHLILFLPWEKMKKEEFYLFIINYKLKENI